MKLARVIILTLCGAAFGIRHAAGEGGAIIIRVPDGTATRCINATEDRIWLSLRRLIVTKSKGWLKKDTGVGILLRANPRLQDEAKRLSFPLMAEATLADYSVGQVSVPIEYMVVAGFELSQEGDSYTGLGVELTVLNRKGKTAWGKGLEALAEVAKKLPIPASPVKEAGTYLLEYANKVVDGEVAKQDVNDVAHTAALSLEFDPTGNCSGGLFETTGTIAVLHETGIKDSRYIPIGEANEYCWSAELRPTFVLKAAPRVDDDDCVALRRREWSQVSNNYLGLVLNAVRSTEVLGPETADDVRAALDRCEIHGIPSDSCLM